MEQEHQGPRDNTSELADPEFHESSPEVARKLQIQE